MSGRRSVLVTLWRPLTDFSVFDVFDTRGFIALARRREAVSELELASAHVRMLTADVRLRKLFSRSASLDLPAAHPTCWRSVATSCGMRAQLPEGPTCSFSCHDWPSRMAYEPQIVHASDAEHCPTSGGAVPMEQISPRDGRFVSSDARCCDVRGSRGWTRRRAGRNRTGQILAQNGLWPIGRHRACGCSNTLDTILALR